MDRVAGISPNNNYITIFYIQYLPLRNYGKPQASRSTFSKGCLTGEHISNTAVTLPQQI
jgi:hypothetical protein